MPLGNFDLVAKIKEELHFLENRLVIYIYKCLLQIIINQSLDKWTSYLN